MTAANIEKLRADAAWHREQAERIEHFIADNAITLPNDTDALVPVKDAADALGVRVETARRWAKDGQGCEIGKRWYLRKAIVDAGRRRTRVR